MQESKNKATPTQIILGSEHSYKITTCSIHAHFINMARPGTYENTLNKMLRANGLPHVVVPGHILSRDVFGARVPASVGATASLESVSTGISGFQEEGYGEMMESGEDAAGRGYRTDEKKEERQKDQRVAKLKKQKEERRMRRGRTFRSMEELAMPLPEREEVEGATALKVGEGKVTTKDREKEPQLKKAAEIYGKTLGLQVMAAESKPFTKQITYEMLMEGIKDGDFKYTYIDK